MKKILILMLIALMVGKPLMVLATTDLHIEDIWYEDINDTTVELYRYHNHFDHTPAGATTSQLLCGITSEVAMSEAEVEAAINANSLEAQILTLSNLEFLDFYTNTPVDGSGAWVDVSQVTNIENLDGYECIVYLDSVTVFTTRVYVVGEAIEQPVDPTPLPTPEPEPAEEIIHETEVTTNATVTFVTATPTPTNTPTPTPEPTPTAPLPKPTDALVGERANPLAAPIPEPTVAPPTTMSAIEITGLCVETLATLAVGISLISDFKIIKFCKRNGGGQL